MKISIDWLKDYVEFDKSGQEIADILSDLGFPLEGIEEVYGDTVIDIEVSSNRGDCLSHIGVAREVAAFLGKELKLPKFELPEADAQAADMVTVQIDEPELCERYTARVIIGAKIGPSPEWMSNRLESVGVRSVNNVVDATNYAMLETGQPPHAFDCDKIGGGKIIVRKAVKGERIVSIDETKCELDENMLVIADEKVPVAIAGVMGGLDTEISESTNAILLEEARFDPVTVRTTGRKLGISSEASFRFERFVDTEMIDWASQRTADLIIKVAGGKVAKGVVDAYPGKGEAETVGMRFSRMKHLLGIDVAVEDVVRIFAGLGFNPEVKNDDLIVATAPTWRHDIYREVDLIEEVIRSYGLSNLPVEQKLNIEVIPVDEREKVSVDIRTFLNSCGFYETINVTFVDEVAGSIFSSDANSENICVKDASRKSANMLRQSLLGSLLGVMKSNLNARNTPCRIFEIANTFCPSAGSELPVEKTKVALMYDGDFRELKGAIEGLVRAMNKDVDFAVKPAEIKWYMPGGEIYCGEKIIGSCGVIPAEVAGKFDIKGVEVVAAELDFEELLLLTGGVPTFKQIPRFPSITRDLSLILDEAVSWSDIENAVRQKGPAELEEVQFTGIYRGKPITNGKKSVTASLRFRDEDGTLRHDIVDGFESEILEELKNTLKAELRTL